MSKQQYMWMLGLVIAWRQRFDDDQGDPLSIEMDKVTGVAGCLREHERRAANDEVTAMLIFVLIMAWSCAKYSAKFVNRRPDSCKLTRREFSRPVTPNPAQTLLYVVVAWVFHQCHSDHLPTLCK